MEDDQHYQSDENQEMDPNGGPISGALADQRVSRKRAQEDVKLLANRIALLKQEEQKAWKKIEETKKKANDIIDVRQRNADNHSRKNQLQMQREQAERELQLRNQQMRLNQKEAIRNQQMTQAEKNYREAERLKAETQQHEQMINIQKETEQLKAKGMKQMIRNQKDEALEMRMLEKE